MDLNETWKRVLKILKKTLDNSVGYRVYIESAVPMINDGKMFTISVPMAISKNMILCRYKTFIQSALEQVLGEKLTLNVIVSDRKEPLNQEEAIPEIIDPTTIGANSVNPNYTFDNFVTGSPNEYITAAAQSIAEKPGYGFNPFVIYGKSGIGKTHLMHAIGNRIKNLYPEYNVLYVTAETFTNEFINALKNNTTIEFKKKYRSEDVLLIDDIQFIQNKDSTQEEFFHTFNALYSLNKQIVVTSDKKPNDLKKLEERLRSRLMQGLTDELCMPSFETRVAILKKKAEFHNIKIPEDVFSYIAEQINSNIRELEGALIKVISMSQISGNKINVEFARHVLKTILPEEGKNKITTDRIIEKVSAFYNISKSDLTGNIRTANFALPRQVAMYLCHKEAKAKFSIIGNIFDKDRSTVSHNVKKIENEIEKDEELKSDINYIINDISSD